MLCAGRNARPLRPRDWRNHHSDELEDELKFDIDTFNRQVITEPFNRAVLEEISRDLGPEGEGKTLIYAVDDRHADLIVTLLKKIYEPMGVPNDAILKITGSVGGGNPGRVREAVKRFKNEKFPNIAVTVDLLSTGIDVPEITTLVFMRRVKSRILFEQMLGRATRLCPAIHKTHFEIYDPVGVYESLDPISNMKPVAQNESATFDNLLDGLKALNEEARLMNRVDLIIARMRRKGRGLNEAALKNFSELANGLTPAQFIDEIARMPIREASERLLSSARLLSFLGSGSERGARLVVLSDKLDKLQSHKRGYGNAETPEDYLREFTAFVTGNLNAIAALNVVCTRPKELTRETLKSLKLELDRAGFTETRLNTAWREWKNEDIAADIVSFIWRCAIGSALAPHEERIRRAVERLRKAHDFSTMERGWLERIEKRSSPKRSSTGKPSTWAPTRTRTALSASTKPFMAASMLISPNSMTTSTTTEASPHEQPGDRRPALEPLQRPARRRHHLSPVRH